jgi:hypothetical protein
MQIDDRTQSVIDMAKGLEMREIEIDGNLLVLSFVDGSKLKLWDDMQNCCEHRYMTCDDELEHYKRLVFMGAELRDGPNISEPDDYTVHNQQFLLVDTTLGAFTVATHNEHNGYYGGFGLAAEFTNAAGVAHSSENEPSPALVALAKLVTP